MAFKKSEEYRKDKYGAMLVLPNDQDFVDLILLYQSQSDVLLADVHYIKSDEYSGYVHCLGQGCPACNHITPGGQKGIRIQPKLFIPIYSIESKEIMFFDRSVKFENQLQNEVFTKFPNPSEYVFRLTRHGAPGSMETYYTFVAVGNNVVKSYEKIFEEFEIKLDENDTPDFYEYICREVDAITMQRWLSNSNSSSGTSSTSAMVDYAVTPRVSSVDTSTPIVPPPDFVSDLEGDEIGDTPEF